MATDIENSGLLPLIKMNNLMELFPKILHTDKEDFKITPSEFIKQMSLTTEERHKLLVHNCNMKPSSCDECPTQIRIVPNILVFQKCKARSTNVVTLLVKNIGKNLLPLKMFCPSSIYFSATPASTPMHKLAPGLSVEYKITFTPKEMKDYSHHIAFKCKEETFYVPIIALGPRAILDIPDQIFLNPAPVKLGISKCIAVRNIGDIPASFNFITESPFKVNPTKGFLSVHDSMIVSVFFESSNVGEVTGKLYLVLETGEKLTINLQGAAENVSVRLEKSSLVHEDTFLGLKRCKSVRLFNNSSSVIKYCWKKRPTIEEDLSILESLKPKYEEMAKFMLHKDTHLKYFELCNSEGHKLSCERILKDELQLLEKEEFKFTHDNFTITPEKGEIWPKASVEFVVSFAPKTCGAITTEAYLEVTGRDTRIPFQIRGHCLGPKIVLNPQTLDTDYIYLCSQHKYEVIAVNKGDIPGRIKYKMESSIFGGKIDVEPESRILNPGECGVFIVTFTSNKQGEFIEQLSFIILESQEIVSFILTGKIVSPTLHFDRRSIDFGTIPFGFPAVRDVTLNNLSVVPVTFSLKVMSDGQTPSISYKRFASVAAKPRVPLCPKEFQIDPQESVVEPFSSKKVTLTLTANKTGKFFTSLEMDMWDSGSGSVSCPIRFHSVIPNITSEPESINIPFCFINFPYTRSIILRNTSKVAGFFYIVPPDPNENNTMTCSASTPQGVIEPSSSLTIDITLITSALGRQYLPINLLVFGYEVWKEVCTISCVGQGPVVTVSSYNLHWGEILLLEESHKTLTICNESPIPATGRASLTRINSPWSVDIRDFTLAPSDKVNINVSLLLRDRGKFKDTLKLYIHNGKVLNITLSANGVGSSLNIQPKIYPTFDLDTLFSHKNYEIEILIENKGSKPYGLVWSPFPDYTHFVSMKLVNPPNMIFKFEPTKMDLLPGEIKTLNLVVRSTNTGYFNHAFYCFASIGVPSKELHFTMDVFATFVEPLVIFDKSELRYWYNIGYDGTDRKLEDEVKLSNISVLPLHVYLTVRHPFRILSPCNENLQNYEILLKGNTSEKITIRFLPEIKLDSVSRTYSGILNVAFQEHAKKFNLALNGEVNYPTLLIMPKTINFDFVPIAMNVYREIILVNVSPLTVYFHITWNALTAELVDIGKKAEPISYVEYDKDFKESPLDVDVKSDKSDKSSKEKIRKSGTGSNKKLNACEMALDVPLLKIPKIEISKAEIKKIIFPVAKKYYECEEELINAYRMARSSDLECIECVPDYGKICDITPLFGKLEKYSSQVLSVRFCSETAVSLHLEAMINIKSGPTEIITIDAVANDVRFYIETREIDFGKQLFCKPANQPLKIQNIGEMPFTYEVVLKMEHGIRDPPFPPEKGLLTVTPQTGTVNSYSCVELTVSYLPRIPGSFDVKFKLHIAYLDPMIITVKGYGVFPQVHLALPRTEMLSIPTETGYVATAGITSNWYPNEYQTPEQYEIRYIKPYRSQESNIDNISDYEEPNVLVGDWEFIKHNESMPTDIDIQLAIERTLAINLMSKNSENQTLFSVYARSIPQFIVPAYETNFGTVIIGRCVERTLTVTNYGPLPVIFYARFGPHMKESGINVRLKNRNELPIGVSLSFIVSFIPKKNKYKKQLEVVDDFFYFEIYHGPKVPIKVLATVTYPYVIASSAILNYYEVVCGNCKAINLKLKNPGLVPAQWSIAFLSNSSKVLQDDFKDGRYMFHLNYKSGYLNPEEYCTIQISFKPDFEGRFVATLWVQVSESLEELKVLLVGEGIEPKLNISENVLTFGPTPPYPNKLDKYFTVENPSPFPIEFYFPTFDEQIYEEEKIIRAVCTYYQSREILLPVRKPGEGLPIELVNFYQILLEDLNTKYMEQERGKITETLDDSMSAVLSSEDDPLGSSSQISFTEKKKKKMKRSMTRTRTSVESTRTFNIELDSKKEESVHSIFQKKTPSEIENMLQSHIQQLLETNPEYDPIQAALKSTILPPKEEEYKQGLLVIFHGAPYTNAIQLVNRAALASGYQAISVDRIILEEATYARCEAGLTARELIQDAYWDHIEVKTDHNFQEMDLDELNERSSNFASIYEEIEKKFDALKTMRENLIASKGKQGAKSSSAKSESAKAKDKPATPFLKPMNINAPLANITEDLVLEILKFRIPIEVSKGMILESLQSVFVTSCMKVLTFVLKCAGNIHDILAIFLLNSYAQYNRCLYAAQIEQENIKMMLREQMLTLLEEEDEEKILECLNLEAGEENEEFSELREFFLQQRHISFDLYAKKKKEFYEILRLLNITGKVPDGIRFEESSSPVEKKKEAAKSVKQSEGGRAGSEDKAGKGKKDPIEAEFIAFESELAEIRATVENWDQRIGAPLIDVAVDAKNKKGQTPRKPTEVTTQSSFGKSNPGRGIHVWLVDLSRPEKDSFAGVSCHLRNVLQSRYVPSESDNWPLTTTESMMFSVVSYPSVRNKPPVSDVFRLTYSEPVTFPEEENGEADEVPELPHSISTKLNRSTSQISFKGRKRSCVTAKRRREDSRMSTDSKGFRKISLKPLHENFKSRWIVQPMESLTWRVRYFPGEPGEIKEDFPLNVINWQSNSSVLCIGVCDIPALDMTPEVFYPAVAAATPVFSPIAAYLYSDDVYDFGSIAFVQQSGFRCSERNANFHLLNKSSLPVDLTVLSSLEGVADDGTGTVPHLRFEPDKFYLEPGESSYLHVTVCPNKYGEVKEVLMLLVKNNPKVESVKVKFEGVKANVTVDPKSINFERVLLRRKDHREVIFTNNNNTPLYINLVDVEKIPKQLIFSATCGWIQPLNLLKIDVEFSADEVLQLVDLPVQVQVFDDPDGDSVQDFVFTITAEAYDVALDIIFSDKDTDHIDFGAIRMRMDCLCTFNLKNVGKYPLSFKIVLDQHFLDQYENDHFSVSPMEGLLQPGKSFPVIATVHATTEFFWQRVQLLKILLIEPNNADELVAKIPINVSVKTHFPSYTITPYPEFNFGHVKVSSVTTGLLRLENNGQFPLSYLIESLAPPPPKLEETNKKGSKPSASSKEKDDKGKKGGINLNVGPFEITPTSGIVDVGEAATINVTGRPGLVDSFEEKIGLSVNESPSLLIEKNEIFVRAIACLPSIDFDNYKTLFREHFVAKSEADFTCPTKFESYTLFTEKNFQFSFKNVCLCKTIEARIYLPNSGLIECRVHAKVTSLTEEGTRGDTSKNPICFAVNPSELIVEPYTSGTLIVTFRPEAIEDYRGWLHLNLEMPDKYDDTNIKMALFGNGVLPQIEIIEPQTKLPEGPTLVNFVPTAPQRYSTSTISFTNLGPLACKVILELYNNREKIFTLIPKNKTEKMLQVWETASTNGKKKPIDHTVIVSTFPGDIAEFTVMFSPKEVKTYSSQIKLFPVDNPFENLCYKLSGDGYFEEVTIEKIRISVPFLGEDSKECDPSPVYTMPGQFALNLNDCYVKKETKALLRLLNKTQKDYFRFVWEDAANFTISPSVGHLYPNTYKEILIKFKPQEPMELDEVPLICSLDRIAFEYPPDGPAWDSRLVQPKSLKKPPQTPVPATSSRKESAYKPNPEPPKKNEDEPLCDIVPETTRMLFVNVSGTADYARLYCDPANIIFKNTFMFQTRIYPFVLQNTGNVVLEYKLSLSSVTTWPLKQGKMTQVREQSFIEDEKPTPERPQSWVNSSSDGSSVPGSRSGNRCRPRPLTSGSMLDLTQTTPSPPAEEPILIPEEQKVVSYNPFLLENSSGQIPAREKVTCNIIFSPMDVNEYRATLTIQVSNLHPECKLPQIQLTASSLMPYCHFNIPESDYLESGRRDCSRPGPIGSAPGLPLSPDTKTIEIKVLGVGHTIPIKFHVINPTEEDYTFSWVNITQPQPEIVQSFHCSTLDGHIQAGRQQQMLFNFVSQRIGVAESFWKFYIPEYDVETQFLFVGDVREPSIYFLSSHVNMRPTFIGATSTETLTLVNHENVAFEFRFLPDSLHSEGRIHSLNVEPTSGRILANSETDIRITFFGKTGGKVLFFLKCKIKSVREAFTIAVEATTYVVQPLVMYEDLMKVKHHVESDRENVIDFGTELTPHHPKMVTFFFTSISKTSFYYDWIYDKHVLEAKYCKIKFSIKNGHVASLSKGKCDLTITFSKKSCLTNYPVKLKIRRGPIYNFIINASASTPTVGFSCTNVDFGYCFLQERDICYNEIPLYIRNKDTSSIVLEASLPESSAFSFLMPQTAVFPGEEVEIVLRFHPKEKISYSDTLKFVINGLHEKLVTLRGQGTEFKVTLENAENSTISMGAVKAGKSCTRDFYLVNKSLAPANLLLGFSDQLPVCGSYLAKPGKNKLNLTDHHRLADILTLHPSQVFTIQPKQVHLLSIAYTPSLVCSNFSETVCLQFQDRAEPLCMVTACCIGPDISLDRTFLNFGAVVQDCSSVMKVKILNSGSIGTKFQWLTQMLGKEYSIYPSTGYCSPESDVTVQITFQPTEIKNSIKSTIECVLNLSENEKYPSLFLTMTGSCVAIPQPKGTVTFECFVRNVDTKTVEIENWSGSEWQLFPVFNGEYFKGGDAIVIPALTTANYEINYCPLQMTTVGTFHHGSVFFRLPNGQGLLYNLRGTSLPPSPEEVITREIPCKTKYVELLKIKNWLQYTQRLKIEINCVSGAGSDDPVWTCTGLKNLDLPSLSEKEYNLNFFAYKPGNLKFKVSFINEETKEYKWFDLTFKIVMCGPLEVITLKCGVRQTCHREIKLENPLGKAVQYKLSVPNSEVSFDKTSYSVQSGETVYAKLMFTPIHAREKMEELIVECPELGIFPRELRLIAVTVPPEPPKTFETPLGSSRTQIITVKNLSNMNAILKCRTDSEDFIVRDVEYASPGQEIEVKVTHEPTEMSTAIGTLFIESEEAGYFTFPLLGVCVKPLAKGPFLLKPGSSINILFKNVFKKAKDFYMYVDNPAFYLKTTQENILAKTEYNIFVGLQKEKHLEKMADTDRGKIDPRFPFMGQLVVECFNPYVKWQFYLKGVLG